MRSQTGCRSVRETRHDPFNNFGRLFDVEWLRLQDVDMREVQNLRNPLDENKQIAFARDGTELFPKMGQELCRLIDLRVFHEDPENYEPLPMDPTPLHAPSPPRQLGAPPQQGVPGQYGGQAGGSHFLGVA